MIRILIADDNAAVRKALRALLESRPELEVAEEAMNGRQALERTLEILPDVAVLDVGMPEVDGISAARQIRSEAPEVAVLMLSCHDSLPVVRQAFTAGALGFVVKRDAADDLFPALEAVARRKPFVSRTVLRSTANSPLPTTGGKFS
jgi:DNA-binding NarL/FixJ family response regulator